ncbi:hypothetical protein NQD34_005094 [Periophthalmus magnuspinnatus]|nr:hypothetical protein NQD34_005094 [Periophthalmus magnuspinnatus]
MKLGEIIVSIKRVKKSITPYLYYVHGCRCKATDPSHIESEPHSSGPHCILTLFFVFPPKQSHFSPPEHSRKVSHGGIESTGSAKNFIKLVSAKCPMPPDSTAPPKIHPYGRGAWFILENTHKKQNSDREWGDKHKNELKHCSMTDRKSAILDQKFATSFAACFQNATSLRFLVQMSSDFTCHIQTHGFSKVIHVFSEFHTVRLYATTKYAFVSCFFYVLSLPQALPYRAHIHITYV